MVEPNGSKPDWGQVLHLLGELRGEMNARLDVVIRDQASFNERLLGHIQTPGHALALARAQDAQTAAEAAGLEARQIGSDTRKFILKLAAISTSLGVAAGYVLPKLVLAGALPR